MCGVACAYLSVANSNMSAATKYMGKFWRHYKGKYYYSYNVAIHTESMERLVVYRSLYADDINPFGQMWTRPESMWSEPSPVDTARPRFEEIARDDLPQDVLGAWWKELGDK